MSSTIAKPWRLIPFLKATGAEQMAVDSWLLDQHVKGLQPSSLRFYAWREPTLSLGYHQHNIPDHWHSLQWQGQSVEIVRRPTGGRAVLHQGDLTYALVTSGLKGSRRDVYQRLCQFLIEGWQRLDVELTFGAVGRGYIHNPSCFGTATAADLVMADGYKLIGSAQAYRNGCVLQHGSIRLQPDSDLFKAAFGEPMPPPKLPTALQTAGNFERIIQTLTQAASDCFDVKFEEQPLASLSKVNL